MARCLVVAEKIAAGAGVSFLLDCDIDDVWDSAIRRAGAGRLDARAALAPWDGILVDRKFDLDEASARWRAHTQLLVAFVDNVLPPSHLDLSINAALHLSGFSLAGRPALLGPSYAPIDSRFSGIGRKIVRSGVRRVAIMFGARDTNNATGTIVQALSEYPGLEIDVLMSRHAPHLSEIATQCKSFPSATVHVDHPDVTEILGTADLAIGAAGVGIQERAAAGLPQATLAQNEEQVTYVEGAARLGLTISLGQVGVTLPRDIALRLEATMKNEVLRQQMANTGRKLVDGLGAARIASALLKPQSRNGQLAVSNTFEP